MWCDCDKRSGDHSPVTNSCIHFYSCIAVFASDEKLSEEFGFFIALQEEMTTMAEAAAVEEAANDTSLNQFITILGNWEHVCFVDNFSPCLCI